MNLRIISITVLFILIGHFAVMAQRVSNVSAYQEGKTIVITYDLDENAAISVTATANNGRTALRVQTVSGDVGKQVKAGTQKKIVWEVLADYGEKFFYDDVSFVVKPAPSRKTFILAEGAISPNLQWGAGLMIGQVRQWGWFVKARSNYNFHKSYNGYTAEDDGYISELGGIPFYSGKKNSTELIIDGGVVVRMGCPLYAYLGAGFGMRNVYWQTADDHWIYYKDNSLIGASADLGFLAYIKGFALSFGVNTINFKYIEFELGLGCMF